MAARATHLVRLLLDLDQAVNGDEIARAWDGEIRARVKAVDEGRVSGVRGLLGLTYGRY